MTANASSVPPPAALAGLRAALLASASPIAIAVAMPAGAGPMPAVATGAG